MSSDPPAGLLLVLSAPSGAGKTTLAQRFVSRNPDAVFSISVTTRAPRGAERDGVEYHFVAPVRFAELVSQGAFAEWAEVHGQRYGTLRATVDAALAGKRVAVFDIDVQGGSAIAAAWPAQTVTVFILPPSMAELERRLRARSTDSDEVVRRRLANARAEIERGGRSYQYLNVNDSLDEAFGRLTAVVDSARRAAAGTPPGPSAAVAEGCRRGAISLSAWLDQER
jgi:guanylate kinase